MALRLSQAECGDPLRGVRASGEARWGAPGSSRRAGSGQRAPGCSAELGPATLVSFCGPNSSPGTSLWRQSGEGRRGPLSSPKHPSNSLFPLSHGPQRPLMGTEAWDGGGGGRTSGGFQLPALGSCKDARQPGNTSFFLSFLAALSMCSLTRARIPAPCSGSMAS